MSDADAAALTRIAARLADAVELAQRALLGRARAGEAVSRALAGVRQALTAGLSGLTEEQLLRSPSAGEWCMAEVVEHVAEHDRHFVELESRGVMHYVEHGLEHALQLWRLRAELESPASLSRQNGPSATLE